MAKKAEEVISKLNVMQLAKAAELVETEIGDTFSFYAFPDPHWIKLQTTDVVDKGVSGWLLVYWAAHGRPRGEERVGNWKIRRAV